MSPKSERDPKTNGVGPTIDDNGERAKAEDSIKRADRWLQAVFADADRIFSPHRAKPRSQPR